MDQVAGLPSALTSGTEQDNGVSLDVKDTSASVTYRVGHDLPAKRVADNKQRARIHSGVSALKRARTQACVH